MKVFVAGGSGVLGTRLVPLLVQRGHEVVAMTRTEAKLPMLRELGAAAVCCDVFDRAALFAALDAARPDAVVHQLTDLPDDAAELSTGRARNAAIREAGTDHLVEAAALAGASQLVAQSIAWLIDGRRPTSVEHLERRTREAGGVVLRYGQWYGPGTYHEAAPPPPPRVHVDRAAGATVDALDLAPGTYVVTDEGTAAAEDA